jgi:hypothetical protein
LATQNFITLAQFTLGFHTARIQMVGEKTVSANFWKGPHPTHKRAASGIVHTIAASHQLSVLIPLSWWNVQLSNGVYQAVAYC